MSRVGYLLLFAVASTQAGQATTYAQNVDVTVPAITKEAGSSPTATVAIPTVVVPETGSVTVPTLTVPKPTAAPTKAAVHHKPAKAKAKKQKVVVKARPTAVAGQWITAFLTSYCPGSAGWLSSSGMTVFYGMLANNYYPFGTRVYIPVLGITGVVEDHLGAFPAWNHFDVWSPTCYGTPTGYYPVAVGTR